MSHFALMKFKFSLMGFSLCICQNVAFHIVGKAICKCLKAKYLGKYLDLQGMK